MSGTIHSRYETGELLGRILFEFCWRLHWTSAGYDPGKEALLFASRGGLRLQFLHERFLRVNECRKSLRHIPFWISRFAALKMIFPENPEWVAASLVREFASGNCAALAEALLPEALFPEKSALIAGLPPELAAAPVNRETVFRLCYERCDYSEALRRHLEEQHEFGHNYLKTSFSDFRRLHLVDTGWYGSILGSLETGCPQWLWDALYFGRWNYRDRIPWYFNDVIGLFLDGSGFSPPGLNAVLLEYHHLLEGVLEPPMPSVEFFTADGGCNARTDDWEQRVAGSPDEEIWEGVKRYFSVPHPLDTEAVLAESGRALRRLRRLIRYPRPAEVEFLLVPDRSADFGKRESTPVIVRNATTHGNYWRTVKWSLWPPGSIAASGGTCILGRELMWQLFRRIKKIRSAV